MCTTLDRYAVAVMATGLLAALGACDREVAGPEVSPTGSTHARIGVASVPVNDDFDDAIVVTDVPFTDMVNTLEATTAPENTTAPETQQPAATLEGTAAVVWRPSQTTRSVLTADAWRSAPDAPGGPSKISVNTLDNAFRKVESVVFIDCLGRAENLTTAN